VDSHGPLQYDLTRGREKKRALFFDNLARVFHHRTAAWSFVYWQYQEIVSLDLRKKRMRMRIQLE
jgi:hypothetical protein